MLRFDEYAALDAVALSNHLCTGEISPREVRDCAICAAERLNPILNAIIEIYPDARELPFAASGRFAGIPTLRKDVGATERGRLQENGSRLFLGHRAGQDSWLIQRFRDAGLVIIGRSAVPECAISSATESVACGVTRNPWNLQRMAGGSSGGAAAAVASGIVPLAHGSDGGGSIRIPAAACGLVGLKPSRGRVSWAAGADEVLFGLATEFAICRSVRDAAAMLDCLSVPAPGDPFRIVRPEASYESLIESPLPTLRIGVATDAWGPHPVDREIADAVTKAATLCEAMGHLVTPVTPKIDFESVIAVLTELFAMGLAGLDRAAARLGRRVGPDLLEPVTLSAYELARSMSAVDLTNTLEKANVIRRAAGSHFQRYDIMLTPALATAPVPHGEYSQSRTDLDPYAFQMNLQKTDQFLPLFNITGQPALTIPFGLSGAGLPIGVQIVGQPGNEAWVLQLAHCLEKETPRLSVCDPTTSSGRSIAAQSARFPRAKPLSHR